MVLRRDINNLHFYKDFCKSLIVMVAIQGKPAKFISECDGKSTMRQEKDSRLYQYDSGIGPGSSKEKTEIIFCLNGVKELHTTVDKNHKREGVTLK